MKIEHPVESIESIILRELSSYIKGRADEIVAHRLVEHSSLVYVEGYSKSRRIFK